MVPIRLSGMAAGQAQAQNAGEKKRFSKSHHIEPPKLTIRIWRHTWQSQGGKRLKSRHPAKLTRD
jgi:hypothetical protein